jgi:tRNA(adenine34) deaminase
MCAGALNWAQIKKVVYGASDEKRGAVKQKIHLLHPKTEVVGGILQEECSQILKAFFLKKRLN